MNSCEVNGNSWELNGTSEMGIAGHHGNLNMVIYSGCLKWG